MPTKPDSVTTPDVDLNAPRSSVRRRPTLCHPSLYPNLCAEVCTFALAETQPLSRAAEYGGMSQEDGKTGRFADGSEQLIGAMIEVHRSLGPGLLESAYEACLRREFEFRGLRFEHQRPVSPLCQRS